MLPPSRAAWFSSINSILHCVCCLAAAALIAGANHGLAADIIEEHQEIAGPFENGVDVTLTCLECHADAAQDFMRTTHWTWEKHQEVPGKGLISLGKKNAINNFCIGIASNWVYCSSCHAGYGWKDASFDFSNPENIDCLVCHDTSGDYVKSHTNAGMDMPGLDLERIAQGVGPTTRQSCGTCHFFGGGGHNVKHGDLTTSLIAPNRDFDVHMGVDGLNYTCTDCHKAERHLLKGHAMAVSPGGDNPAACTQCHEEQPHGKKVLDLHSGTVACQACHVPAFAKTFPTQLSWDWSTAGKDHDEVKDKYGKKAYTRKKGHFTWGKDVRPGYYAWYNGKTGVYTAGDKIDVDAVTRLNWPLGSRDDPDARIYPFKVHRGKQIYDVNTRYLIVPQLYGPGGFEETEDWYSAAASGMKAAGLPFSGQYDFAETVIYLPINHMVAPARKALKCKECHAREGGRLDWEALGYTGDPLRVKGLARNPMRK